MLLRRHHKVEEPKKEAEKPQKVEVKENAKPRKTKKSN